MPNQQPGNSQVLAEWWKQLIVFLGGMIVFGTVAFFVAKTFFVPKDDWIIYTQQTNHKLNALINKIDKAAEKADKNGETLEEVKDSIRNIDLIIAAEGLSLDSPRARRARQRRRSQ